MIRCWLHRLLLMIGGLLVLLGVAYGGLIGYLSWREHVSPSTQRIIMLKDGQQLPLIQPTSPPTPMAVRATEPTTDSLVRSTSSTPARSHQPMLPPKRIVISRIDVDRPVVLSDNDHLPRFPGVGWLMGSGFPGVPGNSVLFGHLGGPYGTFMRLHELQPGDEFSVFTEATEHRYRVRTSRETTPDDVAVLAPTSTATATLITCSGPWDPIAQTNVRRLIVTADYIGAR